MTTVYQNSNSKPLVIKKKVVIRLDHLAKGYETDNAQGAGRERSTSDTIGTIRTSQTSI